MTKGYYSLIQCCPDFARAEAANVGLVLFQPEPAATAVRVLDDLKPALRRLGAAGSSASVLRDVQSMHYRIEHERFESIEAFERFVRTRGNKLQLTAPRPMRIEAIRTDLARLFEELVAPVRPAIAATLPSVVALPALRRTFEKLSIRLPGRAWVNHDFHNRELGFRIHSDYAYKNGCLNLIQETGLTQEADQLQIEALGRIKIADLAKDLEEGSGKLIVVSTASSPKAKQREPEYRETLEKLGKVRFVASEEAEEFALHVEQELAEHG